MPYSRSLLQIDFDLFQRYAAITALLKPLLVAHKATPQHPVRILEVGCFSLNLLPEFLAPLPVEVVRADVLPGLEDGTGPFVELKKGQQYPFADRSFHYVVALEVLEHIPPDERPLSLGEWARIAREAVLFSCPNGDHVKRVEWRADADYRQRHSGEAHPWLQEHELFGRPTRREVHELCERHGLVCRRFLNSPLAEWLPLLLATEQTWEFGSTALVRRLSEALNERPFQAFIQKRGYRCIYAAFKSSRRARQAAERWGNVGIPGKSAGKSAIDPVRLLTRTLTNLLANQDRKVSDTRRLEHAERESTEYRRRLIATERQSMWQARELGIWRSRKARWAASWHSLCRRLGWARLDVLSSAECHGLIPQGPGRWIAEGQNPSFVWNCQHRAGWYRIAVSGQADAGRRASIYLDFGDGFSEAHVVHLGTWPDRPAGWATYAYFQRPVSRIRFEPSDGPVFLELDHFSITPASALQAGLQKGLWTRTDPQQRETTPYELLLEAQRPSPHDRQKAMANLRAVAPSASVAVLVHVPHDLKLSSIERTLKSLSDQDACPVELWLAVPEDWNLDLSQCPSWIKLQGQFHCLTYTADMPLSRLYHRCVQQTSATLFLPVQAGQVLESDALVQFLLHATNRPQSVLCYADEGVRDDHGGYQHPLLKPDLEPETAQHQPDLVGTAVACRTDFVRESGFHPAFEGALVPELLLRAHDQEKEITHIRRVLLHTPPDGRQSYSPLVLRRLVHERQERRERRVARARLPLVSIIIPSAGRKAMIDGVEQTHLSHCLASIRGKSRYENYEILVVDNDTLHADVVQKLTAHGAVQVSAPGPFNFSRNLNHAVRQAQGTHLLFLNDDTEVISGDWIDQLLLYSCQESMGAVGAKLFFPTGLLQHVGIALSPAGPGHPYYGQPGQTAGYLGCCVEPRNWLAVTAACLMSPRAAFEAIGGFDETFELNYNDVDYCLRLWDAGYRCVVNPRAELYHFETMRSDGRAPFRPDELARFKARWDSRYPYDPYYTEAPSWRE